MWLCWARTTHPVTESTSCQTWICKLNNLPYFYWALNFIVVFTRPYCDHVQSKMNIVHSVHYWSYLMKSTSKDTVEPMISLIPQSRCSQSKGQFSADKVGQQQILGVFTIIGEITVSRCTVISARVLCLQQVSCKVWLCNSCVQLVHFRTWTVCLSCFCVVTICLCTLFTNYLCCTVILYSH